MKLAVHIFLLLVVAVLAHYVGFMRGEFAEARRDVERRTAKKQRPKAPSGWEDDPFAGIPPYTKPAEPLPPERIRNNCPVPNCRIKNPHSHVHDFIRRINGK